MENTTRIDEFLRQSRQANEALEELQRSFPENSRAVLHSDHPDTLRDALARCRQIRAAYALFVEQFHSFEEKACYRLIEYEKEYCAQEKPQECQAGEAPANRGQTSRKKGTPKYEELAAMPSWPRLFNAETAATDFGAALEVYYLEQPVGPPARGSFDQRTYIVRNKHLKWAQRSESALHHLRALLTEFQRPCNQPSAGRAGKQALVHEFLDQLNEKQKMERMLAGALLEAANER